MSYLSVSEVARELGVRPRDISDLFYQRILDDAICPVVAHRRLIPRTYVPVVREKLAEHGRLNVTEAAHA